MNEYKVTFKYPEGAEEYAHIVERTEAAARKQVARRYGGVEIIDTELMNTDAPATKEQERETLKKIRAMVAELGPQSYLATAFEGAFEDAEQNIEFDAAFSMKTRVESAEEKLREMGDKYNALKQDAARLEAERDAAQEETEALRGKRLPVWLHSAVHSLAVTEIANARKRMEENAETMADLADAPQDIAFAAAVKNYRAAKERREMCEQIVAGLEDLTEK